MLHLPESESASFKSLKYHAFIPIGCAIFSRISGDERQLQKFVKLNPHLFPLVAPFQLTLFLSLTSPLLYAPFSTEYGETSEIKPALILLGCIIFNCLYFFQTFDSTCI
jgi:hypothetical protein